MQHRLHENENCLTFSGNCWETLCMQSVPMVSSGSVAEESRFLLVGQHGTASSNTTSSHVASGRLAGRPPRGTRAGIPGFALSTATHPHWVASMISPTASPI